MNLYELLADLDHYLQVNLFEDYCPNGLQVEGKKEIKKVGLAVSASLKVIEKAKQDDVLIVHHGIFWNRDSYVISGTKKEKIKLLLDNGVSLLAYHLPLDAHVEVGNNWRAARDLGWEDLEPFAKIGVKGRFKPTKIENFKKKLEDYYGQKSHAVFGGKEVVESAALISGGAHKELIKAKDVDAFITGSFDEPQYHQAHEEKINFLACGHAATEKIGIKALGDYLKTKFGLAVHFYDEQNPF